ncbi:unnamed protein product [Rhodiola kirilowii]
MAEQSSDGAYDPSKDPLRKAKSPDPGWKYGFWPDVNKKDMIECTLCNKKVHGGIKRMKMHLTGGYPEVTMCENTTTAIIKEMREAIEKGKRKTNVPLDDEDDDDGNHEAPPIETSTAASRTVSSSTGSSKRKRTATNFIVPQLLKPTQTIASKLRKTPEEVVEERHSKGPSQTTLEYTTKTEEEKDRVKMHISNFFYENGIPFNAAHSRSYEIMIESIGQFGPGLKPPSYHELRVPLLEKAKLETDKLRVKHEKSWKLYGCTLMSDGWTDRRGRHLINFLVNSQEGTFFLSSVDVSSKVQDANMLADMFEEQINLIGREHVVQVVTDNGANFKAAGGKLCRRIPTLYWTPCAAHCLDLMIEDIAKLKDFNVSITHGRNITTFIYRHARLLSAMREMTLGRDIVRPGATRFATAFLTLQSLYKNRDALRKLFGSKEWFDSKLATTSAGRKVHDAVLSIRFWNNVEDCIRASQSLLVVLRIVDGDEIPAMAEICVAMDFAKKRIKDALDKKQRLSTKVLNIIERRWKSQMEVDLYGAALFLNPGKFFTIKENDYTYSSRLRIKFNNVLERMIVDTDLVMKISDQADQYENSRNSFGKILPTMSREKKSPLDWWGAFGGDTIELGLFAKRIVGLCCSSSGCERNWSTFEFMHTKKRNRLEHKRLNDLVYVQYNRKIATRFQKRREDNKNFNPLVLEDFQWDNEWVNGDVVDPGDALWLAVDSAVDASDGLQDRRNARRGELHASDSTSQVDVSSDAEMEEDNNYDILNDDIDVDDDYGRPSTSNHESNDRATNEGIELDENI